MSFFKGKEYGSIEPLKKGWECDVCGGQNFDSKGNCKFCQEEKQ